MTDHIDPDKVRELIEKYSEGVLRSCGSLRKDLEALLPTPKPKTLADLIEEGHDPAEYQWAQADHRDERCVIIRVLSHDSKLIVSLLTATGATIWTSTDEVIPLPDLPCLVWPAESHPEPAEEPSTPKVAPKVLVTREDYESAPYGTICAEDGHFPLYTSTWTWYTIGGDSHNHRDLAGTPRRVLRWGMGEQA